MITASKNGANSEEAVGIREIVQGEGGAVCDAVSETPPQRVQRKERGQEVHWAEPRPQGEGAERRSAECCAQFKVVTPSLVGGLGRPRKAKIGRTGGRVAIGEDRVKDVGKSGRGQSRKNRRAAMGKVASAAVPKRGTYHSVWVLRPRVVAEGSRAEGRFEGLRLVDGGRVATGVGPCWAGDGWRASPVRRSGGRCAANARPELSTHRSGVGRCVVRGRLCRWIEGHRRRRRIR